MNATRYQAISDDWGPFSMDIALPLAQYRFVLRSLDAVRFNQFSGSAWRGAFGHSLREAACVTQASNCQGCLLYHGCVYAYLFETPTPVNSDRMRLYPSAPHPLVISPPPTFRSAKPGDTLSLYVTVIGTANQHLPYIVYAFQQALIKGISKRQARFEIVDIEQEVCPGEGNWSSIYSGPQLTPWQPETPKVPLMPEQVSLDLQTPTMLTYQNMRVTQSNFVFQAILSNLFRRISMLSYFHTDNPIEMDHRALKELAQTVTLKDTRLRGENCLRESARQRTKVNMRGLVGHISLDSDNLEPFWQALWLGQWLNIGKGTIMGMGQYRIRAAAEKKSLDNAA